MKTYKIEVTHINWSSIAGAITAYRYGVKRWHRFCNSSAEFEQAINDCKAELSAGADTRFLIALHS